MLQSIINSPLNLIEFAVDSILLYCDYVNTITNPGIQINFLKVNAKARAMCRERYVHNIEFEEFMDHFVIQGRVKAEMKKRVVYQVKAKIRKSNEILSASCNCPGGVEPATCKHALALLYMLENYSQREMYAAPTETLQRWHQVKPKRFSPVKATGRDWVPKPTSSTKVNFSALARLPKQNMIFHVSNEIDMDMVDYEKSLSLPAVVMAGSCFSQFPSHLTFAEIVFLQENVVIDINKSLEVEKNTMKQNKCEQWRMERKIRLTASNFFKVCHRTANFDKLAESLFDDGNINLTHIPAVRYGLELEPAIKNDLLHKFYNYSLRNVGLVINPLYTYLGASPDGLLLKEDPTLIEIKCVYNKENYSLFDLCQKRKNFCLEFKNENFSLKLNHVYMFQIQGQMALTNLTKCKFVLYYKAGEPLYIEDVNFNAIMWEEMVLKLREFYFKFYLPYIMKKYQKNPQ